MYFRITAERMNSTKADAVEHKIHSENLGHVIAYGMDSMFEGFMNMFVETTEEELAIITDYIWEQNRGAMCMTQQMTGDEVEEFL